MGKAVHQARRTVSIDSPWSIYQLKTVKYGHMTKRVKIDLLVPLAPGGGGCRETLPGDGAVPQHRQEDGQQGEAVQVEHIRLTLG